MKWSGFRTGVRAAQIFGVSWLLALGQPPSSEAQTSQSATLPEVTVRGTTPLMSVPLPQDKIPVNT